jgi:hypothetical protein
MPLSQVLFVVQVYQLKSYRFYVLLVSPDAWRASPPFT